MMLNFLDKLRCSSYKTCDNKVMIGRKKKKKAVNQNKKNTKRSKGVTVVTTEKKKRVVQAALVLYLSKPEGPCIRVRPVNMM